MSLTNIEQQLAARLTRRKALKTLGLGAVGLTTLGKFASPAFAASGPNQDVAILQFALNLEYLEAEYFTYATTGHGIEAEGVDVNGSDRLGPVIIKQNAMVPFTTPAIREFGLELAADERAHVKFLRSALAAAGVQPIARPTINLRESFMDAAAAAGLGEGFDPFANETAFLLGTFIFEDVGVTAYKGSAALITNKTYLEAAAGILAVEAHHAGIVRKFLYTMGSETQAAAQKISDLRDSVDGPTDDDQGVVIDGRANYVPTDNNGIAFGRTPRQVLNIVYLGVNAPSGGFFPNGVNGPIK